VKFGAVPIADSLGGVVAHAVRRDGLTLKKGETIDAARIEALRAAGVPEVVVAKLEPDDVGEDEAARQIAEAIAGANVRVERPFTGRANLFAENAGVLLVDGGAIDRINDIDERVTVATLPPYRAVVAGEMIGTVKIIPFAAPKNVVDVAKRAAAQTKLSVSPFRPQRVGVVSTLLPGLKPTVIAKTLRALEDRLRPAGATIANDIRVDHDTTALKDAILRARPEADLLVIFGASAITDRRDVIPAAVEAAGGHIEQLGMPVDPGNLLLLASIGDGAARKTILGAPGCARSPRENGFDWVLQRLLADVPVTPADIRRMGAGGLLMEIVSRGQPRAGEEPHGTDDE
jgi:molybdenum cofactor cytidylyltransferase